MTSRTPRDLETREHNTRKADGFKPASVLPIPASKPGIKYRWIRASSFGNPDIKNVSARIREGWEPVKLADHPELEVKFSDDGSRFPDGVEIGGLLLCQAPEEIADARNKYYRDRARGQMESVDNQYLRENDPRMPMLKPERRSRTTFGSRDE